MANLRVVYNNAVDRAVLSATAGVGTLVATNLLTDIKSEVWRTDDTTGSITLTWQESESVGCLALPFCSLSSTATMRVRGYTEVSDSTPVVDTGVVLACPVGFGAAEWGTTPLGVSNSPSYKPLGVNSYAYGGSIYAVSWFQHSFIKKLVVDIVDTNNPLGYLEASRVVAGSYWSPMLNADIGTQVSMIDLSKHERSDAGDLNTQRGTMHKKISLDLSLMPSEDRDVFWDICRRNGMYKPLFFSLLPEIPDAVEEQIYHLYGKIAQQNSIRYQFVNQFSTSLDLEEI